MKEKGSKTLTRKGSRRVFYGVLPEGEKYYKVPLTYYDVKFLVTFSKMEMNVSTQWEVSWAVCDEKDKFCASEGIRVACEKAEKRSTSYLLDANLTDNEAIKCIETSNDYKQKILRPLEKTAQRVGHRAARKKLLKKLRAVSLSE